MAKVITQIYGCEKIKDAQIAAALGVALGRLHIFRIRKTVRRQKNFSMPCRTAL